MTGGSRPFLAARGTSSELEAVLQSLTHTRLLTTGHRDPAAGLKAAEANDGPSGRKFNSETPEEATEALTGLTGKTRRPASCLTVTHRVNIYGVSPKLGAAVKPKLPDLHSRFLEFLLVCIGSRFPLAKFCSLSVLAISRHGNLAPAHQNFGPAP